MSELWVGHGRADITPPLGCRMMGYASRKEGAKGVHDPLTASALWLADGDQQAVLVAYDVASYDEEIVEILRQAIREATELTNEKIVLNTSHTHAGPVVAKRPNMPLNHEYVADVAERTAQAVCAARDEARPAKLRVGSAPLDIGVNRRERVPDGTIRLGVNPDGPTLRELTLWAFEREGADDIGLFNVPVHGTTMGGDNLELSAEWMGMARTFGEADQPGRRLVFVQGCAGDQGLYRGQGGFPQVEKHGRMAADAINQAWRDAEKVSGTPLRVTSRICEGPVADGRTWPIPVVGLRLGEAALVGLSGEACIAYAFHAREASGAASTMALGYTNGSVGYLPTAEIIAEGGYEAIANKYFKVAEAWSPRIEDRLREAITETLAELMG
jgi:neutral ceramidase